MKTMTTPSLRTSAFVFEKHVPAVGGFRIRPLQMPEDIALIHDWVSRDYARYWGLTGRSVEQVAAEYLRICAEAEVFLGYCNGKPVFLLECYDPGRAEIGKHYPAESGDRGMHILVAPTERPVKRFTWSVFAVVMDFIFSDPEARRVIVEPDAGNDKIHALNLKAGFVYQKTVELGHKTARLAYCTRAQYAAARTRDRETCRLAAVERASVHLRPKTWETVNRRLVCKAIREFAHELLIRPELQSSEDEWGHYRLQTGNEVVEYHFRARLLSLDHWHIDAASLEKRVDGKPAALDAVRFIIEINDSLRIAPDMLPVYLEELCSTLYGNAYKLGKQGVGVADLLNADFQTLETAMAEGHPAFVANNGRIGFDAGDYFAYAPEASSPVRLIWLAAHKNAAEFCCAGDLSYEELIRQELGESTVQRFCGILADHGLNPDDYWLLPAHPWQWQNKLAIVFAADLAERTLVYLGPGEDDYLAQQSIRTFFNVSAPHKRYVKTALSILNMGFMRGLSPYYMSTTPAINDCLHGLIEHDPYLSSTGFGILREVAAIGYRNRRFEEAAAGQDTPYKKMLAALWRESPVPGLRDGQRLTTMAALLHVDAEGKALLPALIAASGLTTAVWLQRYLRAYFSPLLHCFYAYDLAFMPHGENLILVLENHAPVRALMKDVAEEAAIMNQDVALSEKVKRLAVQVPDELKLLSIFTDCFDLIFRYLAEILLVHADFSETAFWRQVADCILDYQRTHPEFADKFAYYDLFAPTFQRSCVNRLQLCNNRQMIDLADPSKNLQLVGVLQNPVFPFKLAADAPESADDDETLDSAA